jgi:ATP-dependent RNA helicase HelY
VAEQLGSVDPDPAFHRDSGAAESAQAPDPPPCPDRNRHHRAARAARRSERRIRRLERRLAASSFGLVPQLRAIVRLLDRWGYADGWKLTRSGERLRFVYNELDLLLAEALHRGMFEGLEPPEIAALASAFTFEPRSQTSEGLWPTPRLERRGADLLRLWDGLAGDETDAGLAPTRPPEPGFATIAYRWAAGEDLERIFDEDGADVGDFVRNCRQVIDLLRQMRDVVPEMRVVAGTAAEAVDRGVVAAAGAV